MIVLILAAVIFFRCGAFQKSAPKPKTASSAAVAAQASALTKCGNLNSLIVQRGKTVREKFQNNTSDILRTNRLYGLAEDEENLLWISSRGGAGIESNSVKQDASKIAEVQDSGKDSPTSDSVWARFSYDPYIPASGENNWAHKDVMLFVDSGNAQNAVLAIQDPKELNKWSLVTLPGYGNWLKKEVDVLLRMAKGI